MVGAAEYDPGPTSDNAAQYWVLASHGFAADCAGVDMAVMPASTHLHNSLRSITTHTFSAGDASGAEASAALVVYPRAVPTAAPTLANGVLDHDHRVSTEAIMGLVFGVLALLVLLLAVFRRKQNTGRYDLASKYGAKRRRPLTRANPAENLAAPKFKVPSHLASF